MTEKQKRFKILKQESYEQKISTENRNITNSTFAIGMDILVLISLVLTQDPSKSNLFKIAAFAVEGYSGLHCLKEIKQLIQSICRKTMLESLVENIKTEMEFAESELDITDNKDSKSSKSL